MINRALIGLLLLVFTLGIFGETIRGLCISVADGDTITIMADENGGRENKKMKIRLYAIDSPEGKQEFGLEAKKFVEKMVLNKRVEIDYKDTDQYGRIVGILNYEQYSINEELLKNGLAWHYKQYSRKDYYNRYNDLEVEARKKKINIWSNKNSVAPWEFRKKKK